MAESIFIRKENNVVLDQLKIHIHIYRRRTKQNSVPLLTNAESQNVILLVISIPDSSKIESRGFKSKNFQNKHGLCIFLKAYT